MIVRPQILIHGCLDKPLGLGIDGCTIFGDYYYTDALIKMMGGMKRFKRKSQFKIL